VLVSHKNVRCHLEDEMRSKKQLEDSYRETVSDTEREEQGKEWCEALIDDTSEMADSSRPGGN
jgi:hypothetical protein